jgi:hypothetical protein
MPTTTTTAIISEVPTIAMAFQMTTPAKNGNLNGGKQRGHDSIRDNGYANGNHRVSYHDNGYLNGGEDIGHGSYRDNAYANSGGRSFHRGDDSTNEELIFHGRNYCFPPPPKIHPLSTSIFAVSSGMNVLA